MQFSLVTGTCVQIQHYTHIVAGIVHGTIPLVICSFDPLPSPDGPDGRGSRKRVVSMREEWALREIA
jgi:hypothetical protein